MTTRKLRNKNQCSVSKANKDALIAKDHSQTKSNSRSKELVENISANNDDLSAIQDLRSFLHFINEKKELLTISKK